MKVAKIIPNLKNNKKVTAALKEYGLRFKDISILALKEYGLRFKDISILALKGNRWEVLQAGSSDEVTIHIIGNKPKLITSL